MLYSYCGIAWETTAYGDTLLVTYLPRLVILVPEEVAPAIDVALSVSSYATLPSAISLKRLCRSNISFVFPCPGLAHYCTYISLSTGNTFTSRS